MRGKKQIAAVVLAVILAVTAGIPHSTVYAEPDSTGNAQAADAAADDTQKEEKKEEDMTPEELEKKMLIRWRSSRTVGRTGRKDREHTEKQRS